MPGLGHLPFVEDFAGFMPVFYKSAGRSALSDNEQAHSGYTLTAQSTPAEKREPINLTDSKGLHLRSRMTSCIIVVK